MFASGGIFLVFLIINISCCLDTAEVQLAGSSYHEWYRAQPRSYWDNVIALRPERIFFLPHHETRNIPKL